MSNPEDLRSQAQALHDLARASTDGFERLMYLVQALELETRAADAQSGTAPPAYTLMPKCGGNGENA
jgi:hypothetical protein